MRNTQGGDVESESPLRRVGIGCRILRKPAEPSLTLWRRTGSRIGLIKIQNHSHGAGGSFAAGAAQSSRSRAWANHRDYIEIAINTANIDEIRVCVRPGSAVLTVT